MVGAAIVGGVASVGSAALGASSASKAAKAQSKAAQAANDTQLKMFYDTQENLAPYMDQGEQAGKQLNKLTGIDTTDPLASPLLKPITMDQATLEQTPGYKFNLEQGLKAVQNSASARGLGESGAALKGAANYATGLADSTYQNQFANAMANQENQFNRLMSMTTLGQNSAANLGAYGTQTANSMANTTVSAGNAAGASMIAGGNAWGNALTNMAGMYGMYAGRKA